MSNQMLKSGQANTVSHHQGTNNDHRINPAFKRGRENQTNVMRTRSLCLRFLNTICKPVFTGVCLKGEDCEPLMVALVDAHSGIIVTSAPDTLTRVKIVVLDADSGGCQGDTWTTEEFRSKAIGNKRLLTGDVVLDLKEGIGYVGNVWFSHTKKWKKKHAYRLGAVAQDDYSGTQIREGFTESFFVKDRRLNLNKKHHPPTLIDEVWRLNGIARNGAFHKCLSDDEVNIKSVGDLLKKWHTDPRKLRDIFGIGMSAKTWKVIVDHAQTCVLDGKLYMYSSSQSQHKTSVVFNVVGQVKGLLSGSEYYNFEMMPESGKAHSMDLVASAFQQWDRVVSFDEGASIVDICLEPSNVDYHMKSFITQSSSGPEVLFLPESDEFDHPQPAISFDNKTMANCNCSKTIFNPKSNELDFLQSLPVGDMTLLFDEYQSISKHSWPPKFPLQDRSSGSPILSSQKSDELDFQSYPFSFNNHSSILEASTIICPQNYPNQQSSSETKIHISPVIHKFGYQHSVFPFQEMVPAWDSVWNMNYYN